MAEKRVDGKDFQQVMIVDENGDPASLGGGSGGGSLTDKELVVTTYKAINGFFQVSVDDILTCVQVLDLTTSTPSTAGVIWHNQTIGIDLMSAPYKGDIQLIGSASSGGGGGGGSGVSETVWKNTSTNLFYIRKYDGTNVVWTNLYGDPTSVDISALVAA